MPDPRELPIDVDEVAETMDVTARDTVDFFLDTQTGEVVATGDGIDGEADVEEDDGDRYVRIPERRVADNYDLMREFIATLDDRRYAERLTWAITGAGAFRRFKHALADRPETQARWYQFRSDALRRDAIEWLRSINLRPARLGTGRNGG